MNKYPRETVEFQPVTVTVDGVSVTDSVMFSVVSKPNIYDRTRPGTWISPVTLSGRIGIMVEDLTPGPYDVWARVTSNPEVPVILCGTFQIT